MISIFGKKKLNPFLLKALELMIIGQSKLSDDNDTATDGSIENKGIDELCEYADANLKFYIQEIKAENWRQFTKKDYAAIYYLMEFYRLLYCVNALGNGIKDGTIKSAEAVKDSKEMIRLKFTFEVAEREVMEEAYRCKGLSEDTIKRMIKNGNYE